MKILFIAPIEIKSNASAGSETINLYIEQLAKMKNDICVLAKTKGRYKEKNVTYIRINKTSNICQYLYKWYKGLGWVFYPQNKYLYKIAPQLRKELYIKLKELRENGYFPDVVLLETTTTILMIDDIKKIFPGTKFVASLHDIAYQGSIRRLQLETNIIKKLVRRRYIKYAVKYENDALCKADLIAPHNAGNIDILKQVIILKNRQMFPLVPFYSNEYNHNGQDFEKNILFYGLMNRPENYIAAEWFIKNVMPVLPLTYKFVVMGGKPIQRLIDLQDNRIVVTGFVDEDQVKFYFEHSMCMVVPLLLGSGIKTKVLSAFASGLPVLSNRIGIEGIQAVPDRDYIHCETIEDYLNAIMLLDNNREVYTAMAQNARQFVNEYYNMKLCAEKYNMVLNQLVEHGIVKQEIND